MTTCRPNTVQIKAVQVSFPGSLSPPQTFDRSQYGNMEKVLSCAMTSGRQKEARHTGDIASYPGSQWGKSLGMRLTRDSAQQRVMGLYLYCLSKDWSRNTHKVVPILIVSKMVGHCLPIYLATCAQLSSSVEVIKYWRWQRPGNEAM